jgi:hypothetical protein
MDPLFGRASARLAGLRPALRQDSGRASRPPFGRTSVRPAGFCSRLEHSTYKLKGMMHAKKTKRRCGGAGEGRDEGKREGMEGCMRRGVSGGGAEEGGGRGGRGGGSREGVCLLSGTSVHGVEGNCGRENRDPVGGSRIGEPPRLLIDELLPPEVAKTIAKAMVGMTVALQPQTAARWTPNWLEIESGGHPSIPT